MRRGRVGIGGPPCRPRPRPCYGRCGWTRTAGTAGTTGTTGTDQVAGVALAAVGSLGRGESGPHSDLDLVLLHRGQRSQRTRVAELAESLWYPLWDGGFRLDHSVRSVAECREVGRSDLSAAVGLLDLSLIAGDADLVAEARHALAQDWRAQARSRLPQLAEAEHERHRRAGDLSQSLEPDLKEAHGGLRDMAILRALTAAWLTDRPHGAVDTAYEHLLDVRDALHASTGRGRDRLTREDQRPVAALLGFETADDCLTSVLAAGRVLRYAVDGTLRRALQSQRARVLRVGPRRPRLERIGPGCALHDGEVVLEHRERAQEPGAALQVATAAATAGVRLAPATLSALAAGHGIRVADPDFVSSLTTLLATGPGLLEVWEGLDHAGLVDGWFPEWVAVRSRPQHSPVHRHTVDRHLLETVVVAASLAGKVARPDLLLLGALLHDIGKVAGASDHSATGAVLADVALARWGVPDPDRQVVVTLVREHLTLIELATRRDPEDPATLAAAQFAVGGDREVLALLAALTEADARAVGGPAWSAWRAQMLGRLVDAVAVVQASGPGQSG